MEPVCQRALEISNHGYGLAQRGMLYASRAELIQSLQLVAQALDVQANSTAHATALSAGLTALKEAQDFAPPAGRLAAVLDVIEITRTHKTPVLKDAGEVSPVIAQQQYLGYAQSQLARAAGHEAVTSLTLFRLGKVQLAMAQQESDPQMLHGPQAMVFCQAAMAADERNFLAANELGVLMARYGQLQEARRLLLHSVSIQPKVEAWHNLSVVHQRLGEADLAKRAEHERQLLAQRSPAASSVAGNIEWVDAKAFAAKSPGEAPWADNVASQGNVRGNASVGISR
jgi:tetratricopeptide (TPR) repeat protein